MTDILFDFINTLPHGEVSRMGITPNMKDKRVLVILEENVVIVPEDIRVALEQARADRLSHEAVMDSMRPFMDNRVEDFPNIQRG